MNYILIKGTLIVLLTFTLLKTHAQGLTQDASGKSSILYPGANIGLNVQESTLDFNYAHFSKKTFPDTSGKGIWIYGLNLKGKNNEGIANLFSESQFTPSTTGRLTVGYTFKEGANKIIHKFNKEEYSYSDLLKEEFKLNKQAEGSTVNLRDNILTKEFSDFITKLVNDKLNADKAQTTLDPKESIIPSRLIKILVGKIKNAMSANLSVTGLRVELDKAFNGKSYLGEILQFYDKTIAPIIIDFDKSDEALNDKIKNIEDAIIDYRKDHKLRRVTLFASLGINTTSFKYFEKLDTTNLRKSFADTTYIGPEIKLGVNYQLGGNWLLGLTIGRARGSTFDYLDKVEYTSRKTTAFGNQQLISEKSIVAYTPDKVTYQYVSQTTLDLDIVHFSGIADKGILALNGYFRGSWSDNTLLVPNLSKLGIAGYFFKTDGILLGGLYLEMSDLNNNMAKFNGKPLTKSYERLIFGVVGKIALASVFSDPRKF